MKKVIQYTCAGLAVFVVACNQSNIIKDMVSPSAFEGEVMGRPAHLHILKNGKGMVAAITNYGSRLVSLLVPDKNNQLTDVVAGFDSLQDYINSTDPFIGATIVRYNNDNATNKVQLDKNGFQCRIWDAKQYGDSLLELSCLSKNDPEGLPGDIACKVIYTLTDNNELRLHCEANTNPPTLVNLSNHVFFNLNGAGTGSINQHLLYINADRYIPVDSDLIATEAIQPVRGSVFDFRRATAIGARIDDADNVQLKYCKGYDHNYVLNQVMPGELTKAAVVNGDRSGIQMTVFTSESGLQFYSGNFMQGKNRLRKGRDNFRTAFCLEAQGLANLSKRSGVSGKVLASGKICQGSTVYQFSIMPAKDAVK